ncbi:MAG: L-histidine N(alpha)-methyltransferase, partial [Bacteroidetes bacterium]|nr:L-histidine N(alpha)-methyltransferase [Bacteroidota bacterium]
ELKKIRIKKGETIHTENSYKFINADIKKIADYGRLKVEKIYTDKNNWFSLVHYKKQD